MMRIVIDMQGAQTESRYRGIGRYTLSLTQAIIKNRGDHEIILALNGLFSDTIEPIRAAFQDLLPQENIRVWHSPGPVSENNPQNSSRRNVAELQREAFLASLEPDLIHINSLFEGVGDEGVTSIGRFDQRTLVSATLFDLIPLQYPEDYLEPHPLVSCFYHKKLEYLRRSDLLLAISESSRKEAIDLLGLDSINVINTSLAADDRFHKVEFNDFEASKFLAKLSINRHFVLYSGGGDHRKNLPRLIQAYASLPEKLRDSHQLMFAGKMPEGIIADLKKIAKLEGLKSDELLFSGYLPDDELTCLYNLCELYVFPTWHEGFGLPALEAMQCGAPVVASNTSSLPEVVGLDEALFDPMDANAISKKMAQALSDEGFRQRLIAHGKQQVKQFSWEASAKRAIAAWGALLDSRQKEQSQDSQPKNTSAVALEALERAIVSQLKQPSKEMLCEIASCVAVNQQAGVRRQLFVDVSEICNNDAATGVQRVVRSYLQALLHSPPLGFQVIPVYATHEEGYRYTWQMARQYGAVLPEGLGVQVLEDRAPIRWQRGDIFFGLDMQHHVQLAHQAFFRQLQADGVTVKFLVHDLLPIQLADLFKDDGAKQLHERWLGMVASSDGAICVSKATANAFDEWIEDNAIYCTPGFRMAWVHNGGDLSDSKPSTGLPKDADEILDKIRQRPTFLTVSTLEPRKGQDLLFAAIQVLWNRGQNINLVLVGKQGWKIDNLAKALRKHPENGRRLFWLEGISDEYLEKVYQASTALVAASINEGFGLSLIEAARYGVPIIARDIPVFREVAQSSAFYFRSNTGEALADELQQWLLLLKKGAQPDSTKLHWQTWAQSAEQLKHELVEQRYPKRQLLVDISELVKHDARTGVQRVVRSILKEWLSHPPEGYRVEPVYGTEHDGYRYARRFTLDFMHWPPVALEDELIDYAPGDVFFGLDMQPQVQIAQQTFYQKLRRQGVTVKFLLYDLLPVQIPHYFPSATKKDFPKWLKVITAADGVICISRAVAGELRSWVADKDIKRERPLKIDWSHLGADIDNSAPSNGMPEDAPDVLDKLKVRPSFLMVGTLEPRKGYADILDAFDALWQQEQDINLVIIGKKGWHVEKLAERITTHAEFNQRLFWLAGISDEYLEKIYSSCSSLVAASFGEGFGLPLIEAAQKGLPIIARDIPVYREVAGEHAFYFGSTDYQGLAKELNTWLELHKAGKHTKPDEMRWLTWKQSAEHLKGALLECKPIKIDSKGESTV